MEKPKFNLDAHSILLLCNGEQVDTDVGKLQLTIVDGAKPTLDEFCALAYPQEEGSELVGKWVRYCHKDYEVPSTFATRKPPNAVMNLCSITT